MTETLEILVLKLEHLSRMQRDLDYSVSKMTAPLGKFGSNEIESLTNDERETVAAFNSRFSSYQEQLGKAFKGIAIEEDVLGESFGPIFALMEKLGVLDDLDKWKEVRLLRNAVNHVYEDDAEILFQAFNNMIKNVPYLHSVHNKIRTFVKETYLDPQENRARRTPKI